MSILFFLPLNGLFFCLLRKEIKETGPMSQSSSSNFSSDDYQLIRASQLGMPLGLYKLKPSIIPLLRRAGIGFIIVGIGIIVLVIVVMLLPQQGVPYYFPPLLAGLSSIIFGLLILYLEVPRAMREKIIACEGGIVQVRHNRITTVRWEDILAIRQGLGGLDYTIRLRGGKTLDFHRFYTNFEELLALIRQRGGQREV